MALVQGNAISPSDNRFSVQLMFSATAKSIRFLAVSDIHNSGMDGVDPSGCDAMLMAGDFKSHGWSSCNEEFRYSVNDDPFFKWCRAHRDFPVFLIPGNHDRVAERHPDWLKWPGNVIRLDSGAVTEFLGLRLWGAPWTPAHSIGSVFSYDEETLAAKFAAMPDDLDVLVLHAPPLLDDSEGGSDQDCGGSGRHFGSRAIRNAILARKPKIVVCGHIHQGSRLPADLNGTVVLNVGRIRHKADAYPTYSPAFIEFCADGKIAVTPAGRIRA